MNTRIGLILALILLIEFSRPSIGISQVYMPLAPEVEPFPLLRKVPKPGLPKPSIPPEPTKEDLKRYALPGVIVDGIYLNPCLQPCTDLFCLLCTRYGRQQTPGWCWNAVAQVIMNFEGLNPKQSQCEIAQKIYYPAGTPPCCTDGNPDSASDCGIYHGGFPEYAFDAYGFDYYPPLDSPNYSLLTWTGLKDEIKNDRPYAALILFLISDPATGEVERDKHSVVVNGYHFSNNGSEVHIYDPQTGERWWETYHNFYVDPVGYQHLGDTYEINH
jgi:peptidase C39-like protein